MSTDQNATLSCPLCRGNRAQWLFCRSDAEHGRRDYAGCPDCDLLFLDAQQHIAHEAERARYATHHNDSNDQGYLDFLNRLAEPLCAVLPPGAKGLDYGCGPGPAMDKLLARRGFSVRNYDPYFAPDDSLLCSTYDFICCSEVVEHFCDPRAELQRLDGLLHDGGVLAVMTRWVPETGDLSDWWYLRDSTHVCFFRQQTFDWIAHWQRWRAVFPRRDVTLFFKEIGDVP